MNTIKILNDQGRTPTIKTERLILRAIDFGDEQAIFNTSSQPEVQEFTTVPSPYTIANAKEFIAKQILADADASKIGYHWGISLQNNFIGGCGFSVNDDNPHLAHIGYVLSKDYWGQGIIPEAVAEIINFGFNNHPIEFFQIPHYEGNPKSGRVAQKLGFVKDGVLRGYSFTKRVLHNTVIYSLSRAEWKEQAYYKSL